ncbi:Rz1-like lysis system protein LysC [Pantoea agglomerans]|uniref:Rz1-like lysis system protein LysC n=1 Tax=Enterobacter agglomerans TaxID=549 RepID=UPI003BFA765B
MSGCGTQQTLPAALQPATTSPWVIPASLINPIDVPGPGKDMTYGDAVELNIVLYSILSQCNKDRSTLRKLEAKTKLNN